MGRTQGPHSGWRVSSGRLAHRGASRARDVPPTPAQDAVKVYRKYRDFRGRSLDMEYHNSPQVLLDRLDRLLAEVPASPCYAEDLNDPEYTFTA